MEVSRWKMRVVNQLRTNKESRLTKEFEHVILGM